MFSPYYARERRRGSPDPEDHCAFNVALYGEGGGRWTFTERGRGAVERSASSLAIGPSALQWDGRALLASIDEMTAPLPARIRGALRVEPAALGARSFALDERGRHRWWPIAPCARIDVRLERPRLQWSGRAYVDSNAGDEPLEDAFERWHWSRCARPDGRTTVFYDVVRRAAAPLSIAARFDPSGACEEIEAPPPTALPRSRWRIEREARAENGRASLIRTLEDTPFYARSLLAAPADGAAAWTVHESLSLDRFRARWVQALLPFRAPRRRGGRR